MRLITSSSFFLVRYVLSASCCRAYRASTATGAAISNTAYGHPLATDAGTVFIVVGFVYESSNG